MPHYRWFAINLDGEEFEGELWAINKKQLESYLLKKELGLMGCERKPLAFYEKLTLSEQLQLFKQIESLVGAGLLISQALSVVSRHGSSFKKALVLELYQAVKYGGSFSQTLGSFPHLFNQLLMTLIQAGEQAGNLPVAFSSVVGFLDMQVSLQKKVRQALQGPLITLFFFCIVLLVIFMAIIPSFEQLTIVTNQKIPQSLQRLIDWSRIFQELSWVFIFIMGALVVFSGWLFTKTGICKRIRDWFVTHVFLIQSIYWNLNSAFFFRALSLLMSGGISLDESLQLVGSFVDNVYVKRIFDCFSQKVVAGINVDDAYEIAFAKWAQPEVSMMLLVGNESGTLPLMMNQISRIYFERAEKKLKWLTVLLQPLLLLLMGLLVGALIYVVYVPIIQFPETFTQF
jgi:type IV pilus assembly protein PilC